MSLLYIERDWFAEYSWISIDIKCENEIAGQFPIADEREYYIFYLTVSFDMYFIQQKHNTYFTEMSLKHEWSNKSENIHIVAWENK